MERMILAGRKEDDRFSYQMRELEKLAEAAGGEVVGILTQENGTTASASSARVISDNSSTFPLPR